MSRRAGALRKLKPPVPERQESVAIIFGHNAADGKVLLYIPASQFQIVFSAEEARDTARRLNHYADMADGKKGM